MTYSDAIIKRLTDLCVERGITTNKLATLSGITQSTLNSMTVSYTHLYYRDFVVTLNHAIMVGALAVLYLFLLQEGQDFSRLTLMLTIIIYLEHC